MILISQNFFVSQKKRKKRQPRVTLLLCFLVSFFVLLGLLSLFCLFVLFLLSSPFLFERGSRSLTIDFPTFLRKKKKLSKKKKKSLSSLRPPFFLAAHFAVEFLKNSLLQGVLVARPTMNVRWGEEGIKKKIGKKKKNKIEWEKFIWSNNTWQSLGNTKKNCE